MSDKNVKEVTKDFDSKKFSTWMKASWSLKKGNVRKTMEDAIIVKQFKHLHFKYYLFLVLDGHGGRSTTTYVEKNFVHFFKQYIKKKKGIDIRKGLEEIFSRLNKSVTDLKNSSGTTLSLLLVVENTSNSDKPRFFVSNVGDSTVYGIKEDKVRKLSYDHKPDIPSEISRFKKYDQFGGVSEGYVHSTTGYSLAVSRAIGDSDFGEMVSSVPTTTEINIEYDVIIMASDGIWDVMSGKDVWKIVKNQKSWRTSAQKTNAYRNVTFRQHDNTSLILVYIDLDKKSD
jgi:protein phosphatase 1L